MFKFVLSLLFFISSWSAFAFKEASSKTRADKLASAKQLPTKKYPWPVGVLSIGHNMQSYQNYGGYPYWHDGLDIRTREGDTIVASAGGKVVNVENYRMGNDLYWEVAILDEEGFVWKYHHVEKKSISEEIKKAYKNQTSVPSGTLIGKVVEWPVTTYGEVYHHLHLLIVDGQGRYVNPFLFFDDLSDNQGPKVHQIGLMKNFSPLSGSRTSGGVGIYAEVSDLVLHEKFLLPPYEIKYVLDGVEKTLWKFDYLPSLTNDEDFIEDFYAPGTCGNYQCRKLRVNLFFTRENPRQELKLARGSHSIEVIVRDFAGAEDRKRFDFTVE